MRVSAQLRLLTFGRTAIFAAAILSVHSGLAAQQASGYQTPLRSGPRLATDHFAAHMQQPHLLPESRGGSSSRPLEVADRVERARMASASRGLKIGAAIGCAVGGILAYRSSILEGTQRLAWTGGGCVAFALPGALLGAIWID
jgi:hypothetical protein